MAVDTTAINKVAAKDSALLNAKIDSIIIEEYAANDQTGQTTEGHNNHGHKVRSDQKRNDTSQKSTVLLKKKTKVYGANISGTWITIKDSINKETSHKQTTKSDIKQKTPIKTTAWSKIVYVLIGITLLLFAGYVVWKNAVQ